MLGARGQPGIVRCAGNRLDLTQALLLGPFTDLRQVVFLQVFGVNLALRPDTFGQKEQALGTAAGVVNKVKDAAQKMKDAL